MDSTLPGRQRTDAEAPWTAARCDRLLHSLKSNIAILQQRSSQELERNVPREPLTAPIAREVALETTTTTGDSNSEDRCTSPECLESSMWDATPPPKKRIKRTYSSRNRTQARGSQFNPTTVPRNFELEIPHHLRRNLSEERKPVMSGYGTRGGGKARSHKCSASECVHTFSGRLKNSAPQGLVRIGVDRAEGSEGHARLALDALFRETRSNADGERLGCRSLFSTCLWQIPDYIAAEDAEARQPEGANGVSSTIYGDLENFGSLKSDMGWEPLRTVVRSHSIHLLSKAVQNGEIGLRWATYMMHYCISEHAEDEAQFILTAMLDNVKVDHGESIEDHQSIMGAIETFASRTGRYGHAYEQISKLLEADRMPTTWITSRIMVSCLNGAIESLTQEQDDNHAQQAANLLRTVVRKSYKPGAFSLSDQVHSFRLHKLSQNQHPFRELSLSTGNSGSIVDIDDRVPNTKSRRQRRITVLAETAFSILTILSTVNILHQRRAEHNQCQDRWPCLRVLQLIGLEARQHLETASRQEPIDDPRRASSSTMIMPLLAAGLATMAVNEPSILPPGPASLDILALSLLTPSQAAANSVGSFLAKVARSCARVAADDHGLKFMQGIVQHIQVASTQLGDNTEGMKFLADLRVAAAFAFCAESGHPDHLEWAAQMERTIGEPAPAWEVDTPGQLPQRSSNGFRWEDGISEWVQKTPAAALPLLQTPIKEGVGTKCDTDPLEELPFKFFTSGEKIVGPFECLTSDHVIRINSSSVSESRPASASDVLNGSSSALNLQQSACLYGVSPMLERQRKKRCFTRVHCVSEVLSEMSETVKAIDSRNATEASLPQLFATDTFQSIDSEGHSDSDELSTPYEPLQQSTRSLWERANLLQSVKRRRLSIGSTRRAHDVQELKALAVKAATPRTPAWITKRTSLGFKRDDGDAEDELGS